MLSLNLLPVVGDAGVGDPEGTMTLGWCARSLVSTHHNSIRCVFVIGGEVHSVCACNCCSLRESSDGTSDGTYKTMQGKQKRYEYLVYNQSSTCKRMEKMCIRYIYDGATWSRDEKRELTTDKKLFANYEPAINAIVPRFGGNLGNSSAHKKMRGQNGLN